MILSYIVSLPVCMYIIFFLQVSLSATAMGGVTTVAMVAVKYVEGGSISTLDSSSIMEVI